jgi:hypothetical protein
MPRTNLVLALLAAAALSTTTIPRAASAGSFAFGYDNHELAWALTTDGNTSMSSLEDKDSFNKLKDEYGDDFLYIRDGEDRYVIRDRGLMARAKAAAKPVGEAGREIGAVAGMRVREALGNAHEGRDRARIARRIGRISSKIARLSRDGEDTEDLEREQAELQRQLADLTGEARDRGKARQADSEIEERSERASRRMNDAVRHMRKEMRAILRDAKSRHLAEPVE